MQCLDPDLELRVAGGVDLLALLAFLPSVIPSFLPKIRGAGPCPLPLPIHRVHVHSLDRFQQSFNRVLGSLIFFIQCNMIQLSTGWLATTFSGKAKYFHP